MAHTGLYVFGTSVLWGQGHDRATKLHTRLATWLRGRHRRTVAVRHFAHSGAVLVGGSRATRLHGEVPTPFPSVLRQIRLAPPPTEKRVRVLVDGGINDVGVLNIVNPQFSRARLRQKIARTCHLDMGTVLAAIGRKYRGADVFVLGYYQILADRIRRRADLVALLDVWNLTEPVSGARTNLVARAVENSKLFRHESDRQLQRAVREANRTATGAIRFVPSTYLPANGLFGRDPLLFGLGDRDPQLDDRVLPCWRAVRRGRTKFHCYLAAIGHPNKRGVTRYLRGVKQALNSLGPGV